MKKVLVSFVLTALVLAAVVYAAEEVVQIVSERSIAASAAMLAEQLESYEQLYHKKPSGQEIFRLANAAARWSSYKEKYGDGWFDTVYDDAKKGQAVVAAAKSVLIDSVLAKKWYEHYKPIAIAEVKKNNLGWAVERVVKEVPLLLQPTGEKKKAAEKYLSYMRRCMQGSELKWDAACDDSAVPSTAETFEIYRRRATEGFVLLIQVGEGEVDGISYTLWWGERRRTEGKDELIAAWVWAMKDLNQAVKADVMATPAPATP